MFTGIIEDIGRIKSIQSIFGGMKLGIQSEKILDDISVNDSVSVNGVCLTATKIESDVFYADAVGDTLRKTTLINLKPDSSVNLERAVRPLDRLGGHFVQGHVNGVGIVNQVKKLGDNYFIDLGCSAYHHLSEMVENQVAELYFRLSQSFVPLRDLLNTMRTLGDHQQTTSDTNRLSLFVDQHTGNTTNFAASEISKLKH